MVRGFTKCETLVALVAAIVLTAVTLPLLAAGRGLAAADRSLGNLTILGAAHTLYAFDANGRQVTYIADEMSTYGTNPDSAFATYAAVNGSPHPPLLVGWGPTPTGGVGEYQYSMLISGNHAVVQPMVFQGGGQYFGAFRMMNMRPLHAYAGGRVYDESYYPPGDIPVHEVAEHAFDSPWEFELDVPTSTPNNPAWTSYCMSPAAMFDPAVMRHPDDGGWQNPWQVDDAFRAPNLFTATYPNLKTFVLEHHWTPTDPEFLCNPSFKPGTYAGCEPFYFNHALAAAPATLFYDLSTRRLPNTEVRAADLAIEQQTGSGLWSRDTAFGPDGYLSEYGFDEIRLSHHVLTTEGIRGRDTTEGAAAVVHDATRQRDRGLSAEPPKTRRPAGRGFGFSPAGEDG